MTLARRVVWPTLAVLGICVAVSGAAFRVLVGRVILSGAEARLDARLTWIVTILSEEGDVRELLTWPEPPGAAEAWEVAEPGGAVLCRSRQALRSRPPGGDFLQRSRTLRFSAGGHGRPVEVRIAAETSIGEARGQLDRISGLLWVGGPLFLAGVGSLLAFLIRRQLRPLARMAAEASCIGPQDPSARIGGAGGSDELATLRGALNAMLDRVAEGLRRERAFSSSAAHELRTPIAQLRSGIEVALRRPREAGEYREALVSLLADVERIEKLVLGLLELARGAGAGPVRGRPVALAPLLRRACARYGIDPPPLPGDEEAPCVDGDEALLQAAFSNVIENALRHAGGKPTLRVEPDGGFLRVVFADRGPGVPEPDRERIFDPLVRLDPARSVGETPDGFGLGLSIARTAVRAFGGDLLCRGRSDGERGAELVFRLPLSEAPGPAPAAK